MAVKLWLSPQFCWLKTIYSFDCFRWFSDRRGIFGHIKLESTRLLQNVLGYDAVRRVDDIFSLNSQWADAGRRWHLRKRMVDSSLKIHRLVSKS